MMTTSPTHSEPAIESAADFADRQWAWLDRGKMREAVEQRDAAVAAQARRDALAEHELMLSRLMQWTWEYGAALCPPGPDTYGEGMRDAKAQVRRLLSAATDEGARDE